MNVAFCVHCGNTAPQTLVFVHSYEGVSYEILTGKKSPDGFPSAYYVAVCSTCRDLSVYHATVFDDVNPERFAKATLMYPRAHSLDDCVPDAVRQAYIEADRIQNAAPNAYAVMLRRALEAVCDDRAVPKGLLHKRLEILVERGELPATIAEMTSILRTLGNAGAHHGAMKVTVPMTWGMAEFFRAVIEYVYIAPHRVNEFKKELGRHPSPIAENM